MSQAALDGDPMGEGVVPAPTSPDIDVRKAYLDLLKRSLCDLLVPVIESVQQQPGEVPSVPEPGPDALRHRVEGNDWPLRGLTMVGLKRLDDLEHCIESVLADRVEGDLIEAGVWRGGVGIFMRAVLRAHGAGDRRVWLADSFRGLPSADPQTYPGEGEYGWRWSDLSYLAVSADEVRANFERYGLLDERVLLLEGWFRDTLPAMRDDRWSLIRLDGDMYESTWVALENLYPGLSPGGFAVIDDYHAVEECRRAVDDFRAERGITDPMVAVDDFCVRWRRSE